MKEDINIASPKLLASADINITPLGVAGDWRY